MGFAVFAVTDAFGLEPSDHIRYSSEGDTAYIECDVEFEGDGLVQPKVIVDGQITYTIVFNRWRKKALEGQYTSLVVDSEGNIKSPFYVGANKDEERLERYLVRYQGETTDYVVSVNINGGIKIMQARIAYLNRDPYFKVAELYKDQIPFAAHGEDVLQQNLHERYHFLIGAIMTALKMLQGKENWEVAPVHKNGVRNGVAHTVESKD